MGPRRQGLGPTHDGLCVRACPTCVSGLRCSGRPVLVKRQLLLWPRWLWCFYTGYKQCAHLQWFCLCSPGLCGQSQITLQSVLFLLTSPSSSSSSLFLFLYLFLVFLFFFCPLSSLLPCPALTFFWGLGIPGRSSSLRVVLGQSFFEVEMLLQAKTSTLTTS